MMSKHLAGHSFSSGRKGLSLCQDKQVVASSRFTAHQLKKRIKPFRFREVRKNLILYDIYVLCVYLAINEVKDIALVGLHTLILLFAADDNLVELAQTSTSRYEVTRNNVLLHADKVV